MSQFMSYAPIDLGKVDPSFKLRHQHIPAELKFDIRKPNSTIYGWASRKTCVA